MKKILIFGNSGSGKTTMAMRLAEEYALPHLDLDNVSWASPGVRKSFAESLEAMKDFMDQHPAWVIEGCYGSLLQAVAGQCNEMHFLNPGIEACLKHNLQRPWEPHKYPSREAQDKNLEMLQAWVKDYESRDDEYSLSAHRAIFDAFTGNKTEHNTPSTSRA